MTEHAAGSNPLWCATCGQDWPCETARLPVPEVKLPNGSFKLLSEQMHAPTSTRPTLPKAPSGWYGYRLSMCGAMQAVDVVCDRPVGHDGNHCSHDPSGSGAYIEFDRGGNVTTTGHSPVVADGYAKSRMAGVLDCTRCGSMVADGPNPVAAHNRYHASIDRHNAVIGDTHIPVWR